MFKSKYLGKAISVIMVAMLCLTAVPQVLVSAEPTYALNGAVKSLDMIIEDDIPWDETSSPCNIEVKLSAPAPGAVFTAQRLLNIVNNGGYLTVEIPSDAQAFWNKYVEAAGITVSGDVKIDNIKSAINRYGTESEKSSSIVNAFVNFTGSKPLDVADGTVNVDKAKITTDLGFYIVSQTGAPAGGYIASRPMLVCLPMQKTTGEEWLRSYTVYPKDDKIDISKKVKATGDINHIKETIAEIGDTLEYKIVADLAKYGSDITSGTITYKLVDTLPEGIKYKEDTAAVKFYQGSDEATPTGGTYTVNYDGARTLTLDLGPGYAANLANCDKVEITYKATLEGNATIEGSGNKNSVELKYTSAKNEEESITSSAKVYTHELDITKVDVDPPHTPLAGARFEVYRTEAEANTSTNPVEFVKISSGSENIYRVATDADSGHITELEVSASGKMNIYGLNDADYYFKETVAPTGYNLPDTLFRISPAPDDSEKTEAQGQDTTYKNMAAKDAQITNDSGINLPVTGGMGTVLFTAIGILLMAGAVYFLFAKKKETH